jgi:hypothetical protein
MVHLKVIRHDGFSGKLSVPGLTSMRLFDS